MPFAGFLLGASRYAQRIYYRVNKLLAYLNFNSCVSVILLHVSSYSALIPSLIAPFDAQKTGCIIPVFLRVIIRWFMHESWIEVIPKNGVLY